MLEPAIRNKYTVVIGLEVHAQLLTESKAYASDPTTYGEEPNEHISVITLAHPGALPKANRKVYDYALRMGLAIESKITEYNYYDRKNYFYPDLPKGYQITQDKTPICRGGHVDIKLKDGTQKRVGVTRIHMEEDAGKSLHLAGAPETMVDLNRAGVPLIEIVSEPEMRSAEEAYEYLKEVHRLVRYLDICDGNMEEGSFRCDANISVMLNGASEFGRKVEVKNMNSFRHVMRAIEHEVERQIIQVEQGIEVPSETRMFDSVSGSTYSLRTKESLNDYRYFPEPDLQPVIVTEQWIGRVRSEMPPLPRFLFEKFTTQYGLPEYDANVLVDDKEVALYFEALCAQIPNKKAASNWVMGPVKSAINDEAITVKEIGISPERLAGAVALVEEGKIAFSSASKQLFQALRQGDKSAEALAQELNLMMSEDTDALKKSVAEILAKYPDKVAEYKNGKKGVVGMFMGELMRASGGKANPKVATQLITEALDA